MSRGNQSTNREWKFQKERFAKIPITWADNGRHEVAEDNEELFYAVQVKLGVSLLYDVTQCGKVVSGPHRDKPSLRVCYATRDGTRACVRDWDAEIDEQSAVPVSDFASVLAKEESQADDVEDQSNRSTYRTIIRDRYDIEPVVVGGGR